MNGSPDWPAQGAEMEAEVRGDIAGPDYADPPSGSPRALLWGIAANAMLWALIGWGVWELTRL